MAELGLGSDYKAYITFTMNGSPINVTSPNAPKEFTLEYYTRREKDVLTASKIDGVYSNCKVVDCDGVEKLLVSFDDVEFGAGEVMCKATLIYDDTDFPDTERTVVLAIDTGDTYIRV